MPRIRRFVDTMSGPVELPVPELVHDVNTMSGPIDLDWLAAYNRALEVGHGEEFLEASMRALRPPIDPEMVKKAEQDVRAALQAGFVGPRGVFAHSLFTETVNKSAFLRVLGDADD